MKNPINLLRGPSLQPLFVMIVVILLPLLLSSQLGNSSLFTSLFPFLKDFDKQTVHASISLALIVVGIIVWRFGSRKSVLSVIIFYTLLSTFSLVSSALFLVLHLQSFGPSEAVLLFKDAAIVWWMAVLTFSLWYWLIDSGWAESMGMHDTTRNDFVFPQMTNEIKGWEHWAPRYIDYLFLAFYTNTALSPADVVPLSRRAKLLMMAQSSLALVILGIVASRAIGILSS